VNVRAIGSIDSAVQTATTNSTRNVTLTTALTESPAIVLQMSYSSLMLL
jgi:hypothetical protein